MNENGKQEKILERFRKALDVVKENGTTGILQFRIELNQGGIRHAQVTVQQYLDLK